MKAMKVMKLKKQEKLFSRKAAKIAKKGNVNRRLRKSEFFPLNR